MRLGLLVLFIFPSLMMLCNTIYAISTSKTMAIINLGFLGLAVIAGGYLLWIELYPSRVKKDIIIKDYSPE